MHLIVNGKVQGVGFRNFTLQVANQYKLKGYVKNLKDGQVEIEAWGDRGLLEKFYNQLLIGPRYAKVEFIETLNANTAPASDPKQINLNESKFLIV